MSDDTSPLRVRIVHDGNSPIYTTKLTVVETGQEIDRAYKVTVVLKAGNAPQAVIHTYAPIVDVVADTEIVEHCLTCGCLKHRSK